MPSTAPPPPPPPPSAAPPRARQPLVELSTERLEAELASVAHRLTTGTYELLVMVGELDARGNWAAWGALSCAAWLAEVTDIEIGTARSQVRVARAMRLHPALDQAMADGDVSYAKARTLTPYLDEENAEELLEIASCTPAGRLGAAIAAWSRRNEDEDAINRRQHEARSVSWRTEPSGHVVVTARLTPHAGGALCAAIDACTTRRNAPAGASLPQQRADALVELVTEGGAVTAEVVVHVREDGTTLPDGTPLSDHAVARLLPTAFVSLLLLDAERKPIDASPRRRYPTRRQKRVVDERHPECAHPGCGARVFLQYDHHPVGYAEGGTTTVDNLQRLCGPHNRAKNATTPATASADPPACDGS